MQSLRRPALACLLLIAATAPGLAQNRPGHASAHPAHPPVHPPGDAAGPKGNAPRSIGKWDDWQAATHQEGGQTVCYAFTRATGSVPRLPGRGDVVLTVTERTSGRDAVAITAGFPYAAGAELQLGVEQATLPFYTANRSAFARDGHAVVAAFEHARQAVAKSPGPRSAQVSDSFSLHGFGPAYAAITKACPAK